MKLHFKILIPILVIFIYSCAVNEAKHYGANTNPKVKAIGGGETYMNFVNQNSADYKVSTKTDLLDALKKAKSGSIVYITGNAKINLSGEKYIVINGGVTLCSGRGQNNSRGALIYTESLDAYPLFYTKGSLIRISGIRFQGPDTLRRTSQMKKLQADGKFYDIPNSCGIRIVNDNVEIDNCEIFGWSYAGIDLKDNPSKVHIHHNYIHHNQRYGLGYGVHVNRGFALIEANFFDWNRHHIAGTGYAECSYEARYNIIGANASSHAFDMHGGRDRKDNTEIAGGSILIHHNTFYLESEKAIVIRGVPKDSLVIYNNEFASKNIDDSVQQIYGRSDYTMRKNKFGVEEKSIYLKQRRQ